MSLPRRAVVPSPSVLDRPVSGGVGWAVAQLSDTAALVPVATIERDLLRHAPRVELFFPAITVEGLPSPLHPLGAYAFARASLPPAALVALERSRYVEQVLRSGKRELAMVSDVDLQRSLRVKVKEDQLDIGHTVIILSGDWAGLEGRVASVGKGKVTVLVELRSVRTLVTLGVLDVQQL